MASLTETLGAFIAGTDLGAIPPGVVARAKVSLVHNLAMAMDDLFRIGDARIASLAGRVKVAADPDIVQRTSRLRVTLADGRVLSESVETPVGQPGFAEIAAFARGLSDEAGLPVGMFDAMIEAVDALAGASNVGSLISAVTAARHG